VPLSASGRQGWFYGQREQTMLLAEHERLSPHPNMLLQRNLIYTGITRGKRLLVLIGQKKALGIAVRNDRPQRRYSGLLTSLTSDKREVSEMLLGRSTSSG
jgi:ATP-dependent exoDNAse (exonuclease V) alpha subunit